jgi:hypothetical protein
MVKVPVDGECVSDPGELEELYESLHLSGSLPDHEPDRYERAAELFRSVMGEGKSKAMIGIYNREDVGRARKNMERLPWAREMAEEILKDADFWASFSDELLYAMVPTQHPLALTVAQYHGCPVHGGNRSTLEGDLLRPYQWRCNLGGEWWYSGKTVKNPGTGEEIQMKDDGDGWIAPEGFPNAGTTYYFTGAYRCWVLYRLFSSPYAPQTGEGHQGRPAAQVMALAYALTGEERYAHKVGLLLNRLADVYGRLQGIKEGWEAYDKSKDPIRGYVGEASGREQFFLDSVALTYDLTYEAIRDDSSLVPFFEGRFVSKDVPGNAIDIPLNIHRNLFAYAYEFLDRTLPLAGGDFLTSSLYTLLKLGVCLENGDLIKQALEAPTGLYNVMSNSFFRDGKFWYDSISYGKGNIRGALMSAEWCHGFQDSEYFKTPLDLYLDPRFRLREMMSISQEVDCDGRVPMIGDTSGGRNCLIETPYSLDDEIGYLRIEESRAAYAQRITRGTDGDPESGRKGGEDYLLFHSAPWTEDEKDDATITRSSVLHDSGFCVLRAGDKPSSRCHLVLNYGKGNRGHGHRDKLALNLIAFGYDLSADLGYPPSWIAPKMAGWETHTASHFTALIDGENQEYATGSLDRVVDGPWVRLVEASGERAYPGLADVYKRTLALVPVDEERCYVIDLFRITGGTNHDYSAHSFAGDEGGLFELSLANGIEMVRQDQGTLAGPDKSFGEVPGYGWIRNVSSAVTDDKVTATWRTEENGAGIRLQMLGSEGSTVLTGLGEGTGLQGDSPWDPYLVLRRSGKDGVESRFLGVLEPFTGDPYLDEVTPITQDGETVGVRLRTGDVTHFVVQGEPNSERLVSLDGKPLKLRGNWAFVEMKGNSVARVQVINCSTFEFCDLSWYGSGELTGVVDSVDVEGRSINVAATEPLEVDGSLIGQVVIIENDNYICNSSYEITDVSKVEEGKYRLVLEGMDFLLSEGQVKETDGATLLTDTPMLKLETVRDLFDGKVISSVEGETGTRLSSAEKGKLILTEEGDAGSFADRPFYIYDIGPGDNWRISVSSHTGV